MTALAVAGTAGFALGAGGDSTEPVTSTTSTTSTTVEERTRSTHCASPDVDCSWPAPTFDDAPTTTTTVSAPPPPVVVEEAPTTLPPYDPNPTTWPTTGGDLLDSPADDDILGGYGTGPCRPSTYNACDPAEPMEMPVVGCEYLEQDYSGDVRCVG